MMLWVLQTYEIYKALKQQENSDMLSNLSVGPHYNFNKNHKNHILSGSKYKKKYSWKSQ